jgi:hypothetical protein
VLHYDELAIGVATPREADAEWLTDALSPGFSISPDGAANVEVELHIDPARFAALERRGRAARSERVAGVILDDSTAHFERWTDEPATRVTAFDPDFGVFYEVARGPSVRVTAATGELCRLPLMRVVREFAMEASLRRGDVFLHAASLCVDGRAIVIAGSKGSGKTTTLSWSLQLLEDAQFIANDRVRLRECGAGFDVRAMPTMLAFRPQGLELLPVLDAAVRAERGKPYHSNSEVREREDIGPLIPFDDGRLGLRPARYPLLLGRPSTASARAGAIVFPEVVADESGLRASAIGDSDAASRLTEALFGAGDLARRSEMFSLPLTGPFPSETELRQRTRRITGCVPCYRWQVGRAAPRDAEGLRRFLAGLGAVG